MHEYNLYTCNILNIFEYSWEFTKKSYLKLALTFTGKSCESTYRVVNFDIFGFFSCSTHFCVQGSETCHTLIMG